MASPATGTAGKATATPLPVSRLWGVGPATQKLLERERLFTIADVQAKSESQLRAAFGDNLGEHLFVLANGFDARDVEPSREAKSIARRGW